MAGQVPRFRRRERGDTQQLNDDLLRSQQKRRFARRPRIRPSAQREREQRETATMIEPTAQPAPSTPQRWEFCQLVFAGASERDGRWWADLTIFYIGEPNRSAVLSSSEAGTGKSWATASGPWRAALAALGRGGWELVGVQHAAGASLDPTHAIAYFKRPVVAGRPVNAPEIAI